MARFRVRRPRWPRSLPRSPTEALKAGAFFVCTLGLSANVRHGPRWMTAQAPSCDSPQNPRRCAFGRGAMESCSRVDSVPVSGRCLASSQVTGTMSEFGLAGISVSDAGSMLDRCWIDAGSLLAIRALRPVARGSESWIGCLYQLGKRNATTSSSPSGPSSATTWAKR
jgi:hypothetical protein